MKRDEESLNSAYPSRTLHRWGRWVMATGIALLLEACTDSPVGTLIPAQGPEGVMVAASQNVALDGRSGDGAVGFYWIAPLAPTLDAYPGTFDPALAPTVEVCQWSAGACGAVVARMTIWGTPDGRIVVNADEQRYETGWVVADPSARHGNRDAGLRVRVLLDGRTLGFSDVRAPSRAYLPIRFRLESGLRVAGTVGAGGGALATADGAVRLDFPAGALGEQTAISVSRTTEAATSDFMGTWEFGPPGTSFPSPVTVSFAVDPAALAARGPGTTAIIVTQANLTDTAWTLVPGSTYDATSGRVSAPLSHFSSYGVIYLSPTDVNCARIMGPQVSGSFGPFNCSPPPMGQYRDTVYVPLLGQVQTAYLADVRRRYGPLWVIGVIPSCENQLSGSGYCSPDLLTASADPAIATRGPTGLLAGAQVGLTRLDAVVSGFTKGSTLVAVLVSRTPTSMFSFANGFNADVGGARGTPLGGATRSGGRLSLNGSSAYVQLDRPLVQYLDFTVALFAREAVTQPGYVEVISQGFSGGGGYLGRDPAGIIRMSDVWNNTGVTMPNDHLEHHYAVTYHAATGFTSLYVDGQLRATQFLPTGFRFRGGTFTRFGRQFDPFAEFLNGELDDVTVHGRVLSAAEIQTLSRRTPDLSCTAEGSLVSGGGASTFVTFENQTGESVRVYWLNFSGQRVLYNVLPTGSAYTQQTYVTHPWIVTGATSGRCYGIWQPIASGRIVRIQ